MWPGMTLKSGDKITKPSLPKEGSFITIYLFMTLTFSTFFHLLKFEVFAFFVLFNQNCQKKNLILKLTTKCYLRVQLSLGMTLITKVAH